MNSYNEIISESLQRAGKLILDFLTDFKTALSNPLRVKLAIVGLMIPPYGVPLLLL